MWNSLLVRNVTKCSYTVVARRLGIAGERRGSYIYSVKQRQNQSHRRILLNILSVLRKTVETDQTVLKRVEILCCLKDGFVKPILTDISAAFSIVAY